jgi:hypothetical protein
VKRVFMNSGDRCGVRRRLPSPAVRSENGRSCVGEACHIKGNRPGGLRHDPTQSDDAQWLRQPDPHVRDPRACHRPSRKRRAVQVELLTRWKSEHESRVIRAYESDAGLRQLTVSSSTDAVARSLLSMSTGVSSTEAAVMASVCRHRQMAAVLATIGDGTTPLPLREAARKSESGPTDAGT